MAFNQVQYMLKNYDLEYIFGSDLYRLSYHFDLHENSKSWFDHTDSEPQNAIWALLSAASALKDSWCAEMELFDENDVKRPKQPYFEAFLKSFIRKVNKRVDFTTMGMSEIQFFLCPWKSVLDFISGSKGSFERFDLSAAREKLDLFDQIPSYHQDDSEVSVQENQDVYLFRHSIENLKSWVQYGDIRDLAKLPNNPNPNGRYDQDPKEEIAKGVGETPKNYLKRLNILKSDVSKIRAIMDFAEQASGVKPVNRIQKVWESFKIAMGPFMGLQGDFADFSEHISELFLGAKRGSYSYGILREKLSALSFFLNEEIYSAEPFELNSFVVTDFKSLLAAGSENIPATPSDGLGSTGRPYHFRPRQEHERDTPCAKRLKF